MTKKTGRGSLATLVFLVVVLGFGWFYRFAIYDWWRLRGYNPSSQVAKLASEDTMTDYAKHLFFVNRPSIENKAGFNQDCPDDGGEQTIVLGCYHNNQTGIYLYSVVDPKLNGVEQVTAAHETLHAVYDRLSKGEKDEVNSQLLNYYHNELKDKRILATIDSYKKSEPNDVINEMHSVFGTEVDNLPPPLEEYYSHYFVNRQKIVGYAKHYQQTFINNQALAAKYKSQIKAIEDQLSGLKSQIDSQEDQLRSRRNAIENDRQNVNSGNAASFNAEVDDYNSAVQAYRRLIGQYNDLIVKHNDIVDKYQAIATETNQLIQELNSRSASVKTQ